jgi:hypothetical protein
VKRQQIVKRRLSALALSALCAADARASCGSAYCLLNTNWATQGVWVEPGARLDLRYEYIDQNQVRSGTGKASAADQAEEDHREIATVNRNLLATFDYAFDERFGITVSVPVVDREHTHIHVDELDAGGEREKWDFTRLGDIRVLGRMQLSSPTDLTHAYGISAGVKLPTGTFTIANADGERAERSLQPGTGTTDVLVGGYYRYAMPALHSVLFAQFIAQSPLDSRSYFKPGQSFGADFGYRYNLGARANLMLQLNYLIRERDRGGEAEPENSGSRTLTLSPGACFALTPTIQLYAFVQQRLYQYMNGVQLSSPRGVVGGVSARF